MDITIEKLIELRAEKGLTYDEIVEYYNNQGIKLTKSKIYYDLRKYFWAKR